MHTNVHVYIHTYTLYIPTITVTPTHYTLHTYWEQGRQCGSMSNILCDEENAYESKQYTQVVLIMHNILLT